MRGITRGLAVALLAASCGSVEGDKTDASPVADATPPESDASPSPDASWPDASPPDVSPPECAIDSDCDDGNPCTDDTCPAGTCVRTPDTSNSCADANLCNNEACQPDGTCLITGVTCDDGMACSVDTCAPATGCMFDTSACCTAYEIEAESTDVTRAGTWAVASGAVLHGGQGLETSSTTGPTLTWTFTGGGLIVYSRFGPNTLGYSVSIDGGAAVAVDTYSPTFLYQQPATIATGLPAISHTAVLTCTEPICQIDFFGITCM